MSERTVSVALKAKVDGYIKPMDAAAASTRRVKDEVDQTTKSHVGLTRAAQAVGTIGAAAMVFGAKSMIDSASKLNETVNKTQVVFGDSSKAVLDWSKTSATAMGMSQQQAAESASTFGNLFVAMGLGKKPAADMSMSLVKLAGDLASFNNTDPQTALDALRSGLVGEVEPLRKFGVNLSQATIQQEALKLGLITTTKQAITPAIQSQAAYALILAQTKTAQGDFARTSTGLANSQRIFTAEIENAQAALGNALMPTLNTGVGLLNDFLGAFNAIPGPVQEVVVVTGLFAAGLLILAPRIVATKAAMAELGGVSGVAKGALSGVTSILGGPWSLAITAGISALAMFASKSDTASGAQTDFASALDAANGALDANVRKTVAKAAEDAGLLELAHQVGVSTATVTDAIMGNADAQDALAKATRPATTELEAFQQVLAGQSPFQQGYAQNTSVMSANAQVLTTGIGQLSDAFAAADGSAKRVANASDIVSGSITGVGSSAAVAKQNVYDLKAALDKLRGTAMNADQATANLEQAIDDATQAVKDNGKALHEHHGQLDLTTPKARAARDALANLASTALDGVDAWSQNGMSAKDVAKKVLEARDAFIRTAEKMGLNKKAAQELATAYGLIPAKVRTDVSASTQTAAQALAALQRQIDRLRRSVHIDVRAGTQGTGGGRQARAGGGPVVGPGTKTSDSVPLWGSNGEWMMQASAVDKYGPALMAAINAGTWSPMQPIPAAGTSTAVALSLSAAPVNVYLDSVQVWKGLLQLKADRGGGSLGL